MYALIDYLSKRYNGNCTWDFSQSLAPVYRMAQRGGADFGDGICLALSTFWIRYHAKDDSLVNHVGGVATNGGHSFIPLNNGVLTTIQQHQAQWRGRLDNAVRWLEVSHGIIKKRTSLNITAQLNIGRGANAVVQQIGVPNSRNATTRGNVVNWLGLSEDLAKVSGAYVLIALHGPQGGHACAIWMGGRGEDACFFDPNFGEYWFRNKQDFIGFFRLFVQNLYNVRMEMSQYIIQPLACRV